MQDEFYLKQLTEKQVLGPVLDVLMATMPRDNLLSSASLELFEYIKKENVKDLVKHLVVNYRDRLESLSYMSTFRDLLLRYDQTQGYTANMEYYLDNDDEVGRRPPPPNTRMMEHITVDAVEEEYWNTSDDDDDEHHARQDGKLPKTNGASTPSKPLVDYPSDEEGDENADPNAEPPAKNDEAENSGSDSELSSHSSVPPPERLSEKRRREEDEDDALGKLMQNKRRNSSSSANSVMSTGVSRRRKSFTAGSGNGTPKKIAISLSPAVKTGGSARSDEES